MSEIVAYIGVISRHEARAGIKMVKMPPVQVIYFAVAVVVHPVSGDLGGVAPYLIYQVWVIELDAKSTMAMIVSGELVV